MLVKTFTIISFMKSKSIIIYIINISVIPENNLKLTKDKNSLNKKAISITLLSNTKNLLVKQANKTARIHAKIFAIIKLSDTTLVKNKYEIIFTKVVSVPKNKYNMVSLCFLKIKYNPPKLIKYNYL